MAQPTLINVHLNECECERKCKLGGTKCNSNQMWNNNKYRCECKKSILYVKNIILENPSLETRLCVIKL